MAASPSKKSLTRDSKNKVWLGVCGGVGEYFHLDPAVVRVVWILVVVFTGFFPGLVAYFLAALVMPVKA